MRFWNAEKDQGGVTDQPFDRPLISLHRLGNLSEYAAHDFIDLLRVKLFRHGRVAREIGKKNCDMLALTFGFKPCYA